MGPKKSDKKAPKGADGEVQGEDPALFLQNYQRFSRLIGISANQKVVSQLQSDENQPLAQVCVPMYACMYVPAVKIFWEWIQDSFLLPSFYS